MKYFFVQVEARPQEDLLGGATSVVYPLEPPVSSDAGGNYTCVASNLIETTEQTVEVRVRGMLVNNYAEYNLDYILF